MSDDVRECLHASVNVRQGPRGPLGFSTVPQASKRPPSVHEDPHTPEAVPLPIPLHNQSTLRPKKADQTLKINMGRLSASNNFSVADGWSGSSAGTAKVGESKNWREKMVAKRKEKKFQAKLHRIQEQKQEAEQRLRSLMAMLHGGPSVDANTRDDTMEPQRSSVGKERNAATLPSCLSSNDSFVAAVTTGLPFDEGMPQPPGWDQLLPTWDTANSTAPPSIDETATVFDHVPDPRIQLRAKLQQAVDVARLQRTSVRNLKRIFGHKAVLDSGATSSFIRPEDGAVPTGTPSKKKVWMPDGNSLQASDEALLPIKSLRPEARACDILPGLQHNSLVSVGKLADAGYCTIFMPGNQGVVVVDGSGNNVNVTGETVLRGCRGSDGLWRVPLEDGQEVSLSNQQLQESVSNVFDLPSTEQTIRYLHACAGFPTRRTWVRAVRKGNFASWPLLTVENINKCFPESEETVKGHMNHQRQGVRSTKRAATELEIVDTSSETGKKERDIYTKVIDLWDDKGTIYTDQTGKFPTKSRSGNRYIMVMVAIDSHAILVTPMKNKTDQEMRLAYLSLLKRVKNAGAQVLKHVLDNECSDKMREMIRMECKLEFVPPGCHRRNIAEAAIKNFKNHFVAILSGTDPAFPVTLWDKLLPQAELTINLLRQSNTVPTVSAQAHLFGTFDFNRMPLAPMGCAVQVHEDADKRKTWAPHTVDGWYLGTSPDHYRAHLIHVKGTKAERVSETVFFKHKYLTNPSVTHADRVISAARELFNALNKKRRGLGSQNMQALQDLSKLFLKQAATTEGEHWSEDEVTNPAPKPSRPHTIQTKPARVPSATVFESNIEPVSPMEPQSPPVPAPPVAVPRVEEPPPKRAAREVAALKGTTVMGNNDSPARNTRSRCASVAALALLAASQATAKEWAPRKHLPTQAIEMPLNELANAVLDGEKLLNYRQLIKHPELGDDWSFSSANEFGRLAQGIGGRVKGTNTINFIDKSEVPEDRFKDVTYGKFVCTIRPEKTEKNRTRLVVGGNRINYPGEVGTPTADMLLAKILFNSVISTKGARFMTGDIKNFYLMTPLKRKEYVKLKLADIPLEVINEYKLRNKVTSDGHVYIELNKGMYGLPQAGLLAQELLIERLAKHGYTQCKIVPGLWRHKTRPIVFTLVVDDFGVKYVNKEDVDHLMSVLKENYSVTEDWKGERYIGMHLRWEYNEGKVHVAMPGYVARALAEFHHQTPRRKEDSPYDMAPRKYGAASQEVDEPRASPPVGKADQKFIQKVTGKFLYLGRSVDTTLLTPLSAIAARQASPTEETMERTRKLLDYIASQEDAVITYHASDMVLAVHSDAGYNNEDQARSRAGGHFFLASNVDIPQNNGAILNIAQIIKAVMSSATEAELGALYINAREAVHIRNILREMGHPQPPTPMQTDNSTANGVLNNNVQPKRTKAMDMRFHWLRCRMAQAQFRFHWRPGPFNLGDYWTKHHSPAHHRNFRREILTPVAKVRDLFKTGNPEDLLRGCVEPAGGS